MPRVMAVTATRVDARAATGAPVAQDGRARDVRREPAAAAGGVAGEGTDELIARLALDARVRRFAQSRRLGAAFSRGHVAGESLGSALDLTGELIVRGRRVSLSYLAPDPLDRSEAKDRRKRLRKLLRRLGQAGYAADARADLSLRLGLLGAHLGRSRHGGLFAALDLAAELAAAATAAGTRVTVEAEPGLDQGAVIRAVTQLRERSGADVGIALPASRSRTERDCRELAARGVRVRLDRGQVGGPGAVGRRRDADRAYVRCVQALLAAAGAEGPRCEARQPRRSRPVPTIATPDARILAITEHLCRRYGLGPHDVEYQLRLGERPRRQSVVADRGGLMRIYVPYGPDWYPYLVERLADRPGDALALLRATDAT